MTRFVTREEWETILAARVARDSTTVVLDEEDPAQHGCFTPNITGRLNKLPDFSLDIDLGPEPPPSPSMSGPDAYRAAVRKLAEADKQRHGIAHTDLLREAQVYATLAGAAATAAFMISTRIDADTVIDWAAATHTTTEIEDQ